MDDSDLIEALVERGSLHSICADVLFSLGMNESARKQKEIVEWHKVCSDYYYAKKKGYIDDYGKFFEIKWKDDIVENIEV